MDEWKDGQMNGCMDELKDGQMNGWMNGRMDK